jgi:hypothetical protein
VAEVYAWRGEADRAFECFISTDPRVPKDVQERMRQWDGWPHQIYVREARRMVGEFVMTENELM